MKHHTFFSLNWIAFSINARWFAIKLIFPILVFISLLCMDLFHDSFLSITTLINVPCESEEKWKKNKHTILMKTADRKREKRTNVCYNVMLLKVRCWYDWKMWQKTKITNVTQYSWAMLSIYHFQAHLDNIKHYKFRFENRFACVCVWLSFKKWKCFIKIHNGEQKKKKIIYTQRINMLYIYR